MKIDDIIERLQQLGPMTTDSTSKFYILLNLVKELAEHVKAQEPDELSEEELGFQTKHEAEAKDLQNMGYEVTNLGVNEVPTDPDHPYLYYLASDESVWRIEKSKIPDRVLKEQLNPREDRD